MSTPHHTVMNRGRFSKPLIFSWKGSVLPIILPQVFIASIYATLTLLFNHNIYPIALTNSIIPNISSVVGLLLVFRTNSSYDRYYEGHKLWSNLKTQGRNMVRYLWLFIPSNHSGEDNMALKIEAIELVAAFLFSCKASLRRELEEGHPLEPHLRSLLPERLLKMYFYNTENDGSLAPDLTIPCIKDPDLSRKHLPFAIILMLSKMIQAQNLEEDSSKGNIDGQCHNMMSKVLGSMVTTLTNLERIRGTPIPLAYKLHLVHTQCIYLVVLPLTLIHSIGLWVVLVQAIVAFTFFGISAIGSEIENPFGDDANDLPLDYICREFHGEIISLIKEL